MNFLEYLWYLAHKPLKVKEESKSDVYKFFKPFAKILDKAKEKVFLVRRQALIGTASGKALDKHGEGRKTKRFPDEDDEAFRRRILAKPKIAKLAGTNRGIKEALNSLGFSNFYIEPMYIYDPERWAEFYIFIDVKDINLVNNFEIVENVVKDVKMASALPNYEFISKTNATLELKINFKEYEIQYPVCGTYLCGTKPSIQTEGISFNTELNANTNRTNTSQRYHMAGTFKAGGDKA